jgi:hypothetical protein
MNEASQLSYSTIDERLSGDNNRHFSDIVKKIVGSMIDHHSEMPPL